MLVTSSRLLRVGLVSNPTFEINGAQPQDPYLALASKPNFKLKDDGVLRPLNAAAEVAESAEGALPPKASSYQALTWSQFTTSHQALM
eukprot:Skav217758  [mRNA]  locus=scaffold974:122946:123209:- [translate_table: standard]